MADKQPHPLPSEIGEQQKDAATAASNAPKPLTVPLHIEVPTRPWAFQANGKWHLVYELHVANIGNVDCALTKIEVVTADPQHKALAAFTGADLEGIIVRPFAEGTSSTIPPAGFAVVYMWVTVDRREDVPSAFFHRILMKLADYPESLRIETMPVAVNRDPVLVISPPLRGGDWGAANGPKNDVYHRRGLLTINGHAYIAERFAIDWLRFTPAGDLYTGNAQENKNYPGYGSEVIAVADGVITEKQDGIPENTPGSANAVSTTLENICGNHVIQSLGNGLYASYCHMQPGSLRVKKDARVKRGQVLGLVGNSGNSSAPHLHFQICDANSVLSCEGVPYAFRSFVEESKEVKGSDIKRPKSDVVHRMEIPSYETIVRFPD
ncbi:MAG TPA: M23 family metallopeptidase [Candidatus Angelobacter sp.]